MENLENQVRSSTVTDDDSRDETTAGETSIPPHLPHSAFR